MPLTINFKVNVPPNADAVSFATTLGSNEGLSSIIQKISGLENKVAVSTMPITSITTVPAATTTSVDAPGKIIMSDQQSNIVTSDIPSNTFSEAFASFDTGKGSIQEQLNLKDGKVRNDEHAGKILMVHKTTKFQEPSEEVDEDMLKPLTTIASVPQSESIMILTGGKFAASVVTNPRLVEIHQTLPGKKNRENFSASGGKIIISKAGTVDADGVPDEDHLIEGVDKIVLEGLTEKITDLLDRKADFTNVIDALPGAAGKVLISNDTGAVASTLTQAKAEAFDGRIESLEDVLDADTLQPNHLVFTGAADSKLTTLGNPTIKKFILDIDTAENPSAREVLTVSTDSKWKNDTLNNILQDGAVSTILDAGLTANRVLLADASGKVGASSVTKTMLETLGNVTGDLHTLLQGKEPKLTLTADRVVLSSASGSIETSTITNAKLLHLQDIDSDLNIQLQSKIPKMDSTADKVVLSTANGTVAPSNISKTELDFLENVTEDINTSLQRKLETVATDNTPTLNSDKFLTSATLKTLFDAKQDNISLGSDKVVITNGDGHLVESTLDQDKLPYLSSLTENVQTAINSRLKVTDSDTVVAGSSKWVTSGSIYTKLQAKQNTLTGSGVPVVSSNVMNVSTVTGLELASLEGITADNFLSDVNGTISLKTKLEGILNSITPTTTVVDPDTGEVTTISAPPVTEQLGTVDTTLLSSLPEVPNPAYIPEGQVGYDASIPTHISPANVAEAIKAISDDVAALRATLATGNEQSNPLYDATIPPTDAAYQPEFITPTVADTVGPVDTTLLSSLPEVPNPAYIPVGQAGYDASIPTHIAPANLAESISAISEDVAALRVTLATGVAQSNPLYDATIPPTDAAYQPEFITPTVADTVGPVDTTLLSSLPEVPNPAYIPVGQAGYDASIPSHIAPANLAEAVSGVNTELLNHVHSAYADKSHVVLEVSTGVNRGVRNDTIISESVELVTSNAVHTHVEGRLGSYVSNTELAASKHADVITSEDNTKIATNTAVLRTVLANAGGGGGGGGYTTDTTRLITMAIMAKLMINQSPYLKPLMLSHDTSVDTPMFWISGLKDLIVNTSQLTDEQDIELTGTDCISSSVVHPDMLLKAGYTRNRYLGLSFARGLYKDCKVVFEHSRHPGKLFEVFCAGGADYKLLRVTYTNGSNVTTCETTRGHKKWQDVWIRILHDNGAGDPRVEQLEIVGSATHTTAVPEDKQVTLVDSEVFLNECFINWLGGTTVKVTVNPGNSKPPYIGLIGMAYGEGASA